MSFKENWAKKDERCPHCNQVTKRTRGLTQENIRRLVKPKFNANELLITVLIVGIIFLALFWKSDTDACRNWINPMINTTLLKCESVCNQKCELIYQNEEINLSNLSIIDIPIR